MVKHGLPQEKKGGEAMRTAQKDLPQGRETLLPNQVRLGAPATQ
jgi:hypothetical protein